MMPLPLCSGKFRKYAAIGMLMAAAVSCDVHEFPTPVPEPEPPGVTGRFMLHLRFDTDLPIFKEVTYQDGTLREVSPRGDAAPDMRYIINVYPASRGGEYSRASEVSFVRTLPEALGPDADFEVEMPQGDYRIMVWADYVDAGQTTAKYYNADDFSEIIIADRDAYAGSDDHRDAFRGFVDVAVDYGPGYVPDRADEVLLEATVDMERPLAKYRFITTDLDEFIDAEQLSRRMAADARDVASRAVDLSDYEVTIRYPQYMPCSFNMFTNRPADSWTGISHKAVLRHLGGNEAEIGFDYVFVNGVESAVAASLEVRHRNGDLVSGISTINIPLKRSRLTEVRGAFLTHSASGSVGIDPGFEGDFNIFIH